MHRKLDFYRFRYSGQGCQIFLGTIYQNGEKYTKLPQNIPNGYKINMPKWRKIYQITTKYNKWL
jgi:hypothetical protein